jgi:hypothetical protein
LEHVRVNNGTKKACTIEELRAKRFRLEVQLAADRLVLLEQR